MKSTRKNILIVSFVTMFTQAVTIANGANKVSNKSTYKGVQQLKGSANQATRSANDPVNKNPPPYNGGNPASGGNNAGGNNTKNGQGWGANSQ